MPSRIKFSKELSWGNYFQRVARGVSKTTQTLSGPLHLHLHTIVRQRNRMQMHVGRVQCVAVWISLGLGLQAMNPCKTMHTYNVTNPHRVTIQWHNSTVSRTTDVHKHSDVHCPELHTRRNADPVSVNPRLGIIDTFPNLRPTFTGLQYKFRAKIALYVGSAGIDEYRQTAYTRYL